MDDLDHAILNPLVQAQLESRPIYDPSSADYPPHPLDGLPSLDDGTLDPVEAAYEVSAQRGADGRCRPRAPWEPIP